MNFFKKINLENMFAAAAAVIACAAPNLGSETYKMVTYYPAPYGSYNNFTVTDDAYLATDSKGLVRIGAMLPENQLYDAAKNPLFKLDIDGELKIGGQNEACPSYGGALRWSGSEIEYSKDGANGWQKIINIRSATDAGNFIENYIIHDPEACKLVNKCP